MRQPLHPNLAALWVGCGLEEQDPSGTPCRREEGSYCEAVTQGRALPPKASTDALAAALRPVLMGTVCPRPQLEPTPPATQKLPERSCGAGAGPAGGRGLRRRQAGCGRPGRLCPSPRREPQFWQQMVQGECPGSMRGQNPCTTRLQSAEVWRWQSWASRPDGVAWVSSSFLR